MKSVSLVLVALSLLVGGASAREVVTLQWEELPALPPSAGQRLQPGVAGPFAGVHGDALIVAGGANFPDRPPWDGGIKRWWDDIWVLEGLAGDRPQWITGASGSFTLPRALGYGVSVSTPDGVICAGGQDAARCHADVFMLSWDAAARAIRHTPLPPLPEPLSFMAGALVGNTLYLAGGQTTVKDAVPTSIFWSLDLSQRQRPASFKWTVLPAWPGPPRILPVAAAQRSKNGEEFFLFSGRRPVAGERTEILSDAYAFNPTTRTWRTLAPVGDGVVTGLGVMAGTAAAAGDREVLLFGGDRGDRYLELEAHDLAIAALRARAGEEAPGGNLGREIEQRLAAKRRIYASHPGFAREVLAYDTRRDTWRTVGRSPFPPQVTTVAVPHGGSILIPSGEIKPGVRTPAIIRVVPSLR